MIESEGRTPDSGPAGVVVVALDGPAGSGKSTVARAVAERLGLSHLDTGAMYRAVTLAALRRGVPVHDEPAVATVARDAVIQLDDDRVIVDGMDATTDIRGREVTESVSVIAANSAVRAELVPRQRAWVRDRGGGVLEGRDIGTVVFPDAAVKAFVIASPRVRAERRVAQVGGDVDEVEASILERDRKDANRADSPMVAAEGSTVIDTSDLTVDEVVDLIVGLLGSGREGR